MLFQLNLVAAVLFGLGSPVLIVASTSWRWWVGWFVVGMGLLAWPVGAVLTAKGDGSLGHGLSFGVAASLVSVALAMFLVSFLARAYWLATRRTGSPAAS